MGHVIDLSSLLSYKQITKRESSSFQQFGFSNKQKKCFYNTKRTKTKCLQYFALTLSLFLHSFQANADCANL